MTATTERIRGVGRLLTSAGHMTPEGQRILENTLRAEELAVTDNTVAIRMHRETADAFAFIASLAAPATTPDYDDIPTTAIPYDEESN